METLVHSERRLRFRSFEFNPHTHELRKHGHEVAIRGHPAEVLAALLDSPGEVVTRAELRKRLWREQTYVDFEHILNNSVNKLREALGDDAATPHFIQTVPGLGYRFIGTLEQQPREDHRPEPGAAQQESGSSRPRYAYPLAAGRMKLRASTWWLLVAAICMIALMAAIVSLDMGLRLLR